MGSQLGDPAFVGFWGAGRNSWLLFWGPSYGEDPCFWISGGRAGVVDFLRRFLVWADDFGVPARDPSSAFVLGGGGQEWLIS